jgi:hypothetical protein
MEPSDVSVTTWAFALLGALSRPMAAPQASETTSEAVREREGGT